MRYKGRIGKRPTTIYLPDELVNMCAARKVNMSEECRKHLWRVVGQNRDAVLSEIVRLEGRMKDLKVVLDSMKTWEEECDEIWEMFKNHAETLRKNCPTWSLMQGAQNFNRELTDLCKLNPAFRKLQESDPAGFNARAQKIVSEAGW